MVWMDEGCIDGWMHGYIGVYGWMDRCIDAWMHGCMHAWMHVWTNGWMDAWIDAWIDGRMHAWMHLWTSESHSDKGRLATATTDRLAFLDHGLAKMRGSGATATTDRRR